MDEYIIKTNTYDELIISSDSILSDLLFLFIDKIDSEKEIEKEIKIITKDIYAVKKRIEIWIDTSLQFRNNVFESHPYKYRYKDEDLIIFIHSSKLDMLISQILNLHLITENCINNNDELLIVKKDC